MDKLLLDPLCLSNARDILEPLVVCVLNFADLVLQCFVLEIKIFYSINNLPQLDSKSLLAGSDGVEVQDVLLLR